MTGTAVNGAAKTFTQQQVDDFAELLTKNFGGFNSIRWLAEQILGSDWLSDNGNDVEDLSKFSSSVVDALHKADKLSAAITLIRGHALPNGMLAAGIDHILRGRPLNDTATLQALTNEYEPFFRSQEFLQRHPRMMGMVCLIGLAGAEQMLKGTGFLVGPDLVMTNYHVVDLAIEEKDGSFKEKVSGSDLHFFFDYLSEPKPRIPYKPAGTHRHLCVTAVEKDWLVNARGKLPYEGTDQCSEDAQKLFDYAVIRLSKPMGRLPRQRSGGAPRGWLSLPDQIDVFAKAKRLILYQHPGGMPQVMDVGEYTTLDRTQTRVRYRVSTADGSSGGAAVDSDGVLFALHTAEVQPKTNPVVNQGVRIDLIGKDLADNVPKWGNLPPPDEVPVWSLSNELTDPKPIIGRDEFRDHVETLRKRDSSSRVLVVSGTERSGRRYSVKLLQRLVGSQPRIVQFSSDDLLMTPEQFVSTVLEQIGIAGCTLPKPAENETLGRWQRVDLAAWFAARLAEDEQRNPAAYPAWLVFHATVPANMLRVKWDDSLRDFIVAAAGVAEPGQTAADLSMLRLLFLTSSHANVVLPGVSRLEEDLSNYTNTRADFANCVRSAYLAIDPDMNPGTDVVLSMLADSAIKEHAPEHWRDALSEQVRRVVISELATRVV